jgi:CheY-like chemotaxis protein
MGIILLADAAKEVLRLMAIAVTDEGHRLLFAHDGSEALSLVKEKRPDVACLDFALPELNGYEVCAAIKSNPDLADTKVVILNHRQGEEQALANLVHADRCLDKRFELSHLGTVTRALLQTPRRPRLAVVR